jgi:hypothetical protein
MHEDLLHSVAGGRVVCLGVHHHSACFIDVCGAVDVDVADSICVAHHRDLCVLLYVGHQRVASPGDHLQQALPFLKFFMFHKFEISHAPEGLTDRVVEIPGLQHSPAIAHGEESHALRFCRSSCQKMALLPLQAIEFCLEWQKQVGRSTK